MTRAVAQFVGGTLFIAGIALLYVAFVVVPR